MTIDIPGVSEAEIAKLITTVTANFEPRMIRVENTIVAMFTVLTILTLLILLFTLFVACHVILDRRAKQPSANPTQTYKLYKRTSDKGDHSSTTDDDTEILYSGKTRRAKRNL